MDLHREDGEVVSDTAVEKEHSMCSATRFRASKACTLHYHLETLDPRIVGMQRMATSAESDHYTRQPLAG